MKWLLCCTKLFKFLEELDLRFLEEMRAGGCVICGASLHRSDYDRQPCGGPEYWDMRYSLCCGRETCRKRHTPASVRFFGRRVYCSVAFLVMSIYYHGAKAHRVEALRLELGVDRRTLDRWILWWKEAFVDSPFWKQARSQFATRPDESRLPHSLWKAFGGHRGKDRMVKLLVFLSPLTVPGAGRAVAM